MKNLLRFLVLATLLFAQLNRGRAQAATLPTPAKFPFAQAPFKALSPQAEAIWQAHLAVVHQAPIQSACEPFRLQARGAIRRGSMLLLHGFTACPQQYWDIGQMLADAGFDVIVPLLPGHGQVYRLKDGQVADDLSRMPKDQAYRVYQDFGVQMSEMLRAEPERRLIGGLSLGGVVAATALERLPGFYTRALLFAPVFDVVRPSNLYIAPVNVFLPEFLTSWGPGCENERAGGRGGYCQFTPAMVRAMQLVGKEALEKVADVTTTVQMVGVEADGAADNVALGRAARRFPFVRSCLFRQGANHSLLSRYDVPNENKFWLPSLEKQFLAFAIDDDFFETEPGGGEEGLPRCRIYP